MGEIVDLYLEQLATTVETMRRRIIAYYDGIFYIGRKLDKANERLKEVAEPVMYDARDYVNQAITDSTPLDSIETETKNSLVEMYLGISVMLIGYGGGQLAGCYALASIFPHIFDTYIILLILLAIPIYTYLTIRKNISLDDNERRSMLLSSSIATGSFIGYLVGPRVLSMAPSTVFAPPLLFALMFDNGIFPLPLTALQRQQFFMSFASISVFFTTLLASMVLGYFSFAVSLFNIIHVAAIYLHFQIITQTLKDEMFMVGESQMAYLSITFFIHNLFVILFGYNPDNVAHKY